MTLFRQSVASSPLDFTTVPQVACYFVNVINFVDFANAEISPQDDELHRHRLVTFVSCQTNANQNEIYFFISRLQYTFISIYIH